MSSDPFQVRSPEGPIPGKVRPVLEPIENKDETAELMSSVAETKRPLKATLTRPDLKAELTCVTAISYAE